MNNALPEINEELGEVLCDECEGRGCVPKKITKLDQMQSMCWKCQGDGKLDWVSMATGKPTIPMSFGTSGTSFSISTPVMGNSSSGMSKIINQCAEHFAQKVDDSIMDAIQYPWNKIQNMR